MDQNAMGCSLSQDEDEEGMSMPLSSSRSSTPEAQAMTKNRFQPPDSFLGGERSMSPRPVTLEKAMDPSPGSRPSTPATSIISFLSRSSTGHSQDSDNTHYSLNSSCFDGTVLVPRESPFPAMGSHPIDQNSLPKGGPVPLFDLPKSQLEYRPAPKYPSRVSVPVNQPGSSRIQRPPTWPKRQSPENRDLNNRGPPSRHSSFPIERSSNTKKPIVTRSFVFEATENRNAPGSIETARPLPEDMDLPDTDIPVYYNGQGLAPDGVEIFNVQAQEDIIWTTGLMTSKQSMFHSLDSKYDGLHCERAPNSSTELESQLRKKPFQSFSMLGGHESAEMDEAVASKHSASDRERSCSPDSVVFPVTRTIITSEAAIAPEDISRKALETQAEHQESCTSSPSPRGKLCGERSRSHGPFCPDSEENALFLNEECGHPSEEEEDYTYDELAEGITNLVLESSCVGNVEDGGIPIKLYVHNFLQQVLNHPKTFCLPIRNLYTPKHETPGDAGESGMRAGAQSSNGGGSGRNKRKNEEEPGDARDCRNEDQGSFGDDDLEDLQSHSSQKVKKQRTRKNGGNFSCPFRKRNPIRFNVRDHGSCALNPFTDFALLKRHIKTFHQRGSSSSSCVRCKEQFPDQAALNRHLTRPDICEVLNFTGKVDHEDGITEEIDRKLKIRTKEDNVRQWESLWTLLFPDDGPERIPGPEHEPPIELDEVQNHCYQKESVRKFISKETADGQEVLMTDHGFRYFVESFGDCRNKELHEPSNERLKRDDCFKEMVNIELPPRGGSPGPEMSPVGPRPPINDPPRMATPPAQWAYPLEDPLFPDIYASQYSPYPTEPIYGSHLSINGSQIPGTATMYASSEQGPMHHPAPQNALTTLPYPALPSNGSPSSAAGRSAHRSSRPSSQSLESSYLTQGTQETQDTQFTQPYPTAFQQHRPDEGVPGGPAGGCSCSTSPGGIPADQHSCTDLPGRGLSEQHLYGVGMRSAEPLDGPNSDDDLIPLPSPHPGMS